MTRAALLFAALVLAAGCATPSGTEKAKLIRGAIDASRGGCLVYALDLTIPRDDVIQAFCEQQVKP